MNVHTTSMADLDHALKTAHGNKRLKILKELQRRWDRLFWALTAIENVDEVTGEVSKSPPCARYDFVLLHG